MGMLPQAATGWMSICRQPKACCLLYFTSGIMYNLAFLLIHFVSVASPLWDRIAVQTFMTMAGSAYLVMMYRQGPVFAKSRLSKFLSTCIILSIFGHIAIGRTVPESEGPFGNRSLSFLASSAAAFPLACSGLCGGIASAHPAQPHHNLRPPILEAAVLSLRVGNYMTDFGLVSVILDHVRHLLLWKVPLANALTCLPVRKVPFCYMRGCLMKTNEIPGEGRRVPVVWRACVMHQVHALSRGNRGAGVYAAPASDLPSLCASAAERGEPASPQVLLRCSKHGCPINIHSLYHWHALELMPCIGVDSLL